MTSIGVLLINLGTPDHADPASVRAYLKQFLLDKRVVDLPDGLRHLFVNCVVVPFRYKKSSLAYQQIWTDEGSPLRVYGNALVEALNAAFGIDVQVEIGMRYGNPSMASALAKLKDCQKLFVLPLFPQYSSAATGSAMAELFRLLRKEKHIPSIHIKNHFYQHPEFIRAYAELIQEKIQAEPVQAVIFSYHGLPEKQVHANDCPQTTAHHETCYRAQCFETSRLLAKHLKLDTSQYVVSFQSRLGRIPWIKPYTDVVLTDLRKMKIKDIAIVSPSFVSDCLETLEELNIRAREQWHLLGGEKFVFVPCLNTNANWVQGLTQMIKEHIN